jgi:hypothetical protein
LNPAAVKRPNEVVKENAVARRGPVLFRQPETEDSEVAAKET